MTTEPIIIAGGGLIGLTMARALNQVNIETIIIDPEPEKKPKHHNLDGRASALSAASVNLFRNLHIWDDITKHACPIFDIRVAEKNEQGDISPFFVHYDHKVVGMPFGYVVENYRLLNILKKQKMKRIQAHIVDIKCTETHIEVTHDHGKLYSPLLIGADGRFSTIRHLCKIPIINHQYKQKSIVCTVSHERNHANTAVELFLPNGPFAMLPLTNNRTNIIWSDQEDRVNRLLKNEHFLWKMIQKHFGHWLGKLTLTSPIITYPLSFTLAMRYVAPRTVIIGDAAHALHPIAGQGFNLGLRDIAALTQIITENYINGLDLSTNISEFQNWRTFDIISLSMICHILLGIFSNNNPLLSLARNGGLTIVQSIPFLKKYFMKHAMGLIGELPPLLQQKTIIK